MHLLYIFPAIVAATVFLETASAIGTRGVSLDHCAGNFVQVRESLLVGDRVLNVTVPACSDFEPKEAPIHPTESLLFRRSTHLMARSFEERSGIDAREAKASPSECVNPSICHCGETCTVECQNFPTPAPAPNPVDCEILIDLVRDLKNLAGPTFVVSTSFPNPIIVDYASCRTALGNIQKSGTLVEYCWDGFADDTALLTSGCISPHITLGGVCTSSSNSWQMTTGGYNK
ncbi:hypothetical protein C8Q75DRAFT_774325 [Abortiporus biennis]|nr:hypothetical protein C8Q75DRAFT_774325 [Abortiporus biennis]